MYFSFFFSLSPILHLRFYMLCVVKLIPNSLGVIWAIKSLTRILVCQIFRRAIMYLNNLLFAHVHLPSPFPSNLRCSFLLLFFFQAFARSLGELIFSSLFFSLILNIFLSLFFFFFPQFNCSSVNRSEPENHKPNLLQDRWRKISKDFSRCQSQKRLNLTSPLFSPDPYLWVTPGEKTWRLAHFRWRALWMSPLPATSPHGPED